MNESSTCSGSDTRLTQRRSGPVPEFAVISKGGDAITGFDCALHAANWARKTWPDQEQDETRSGKGWDIEVVS